MLPTAGVNRVFGLLDLLRAYNGKTDVANLTIDLRIALDELLPIIDTAEYLALVAVQQGDISLTDLEDAYWLEAFKLQVNSTPESSGECWRFDQRSSRSDPGYSLGRSFDFFQLREF